MGFFFSVNFPLKFMEREKNGRFSAIFAANIYTLHGRFLPMWLKLPNSKSILHIKRRRTSLSFSSHLFFSSSFQPNTPNKQVFCFGCCLSWIIDFACYDGYINLPNWKRYISTYSVSAQWPLSLVFRKVCVNVCWTFFVPLISI